MIRLEIFNEVMFVVLSYHMITFTQFVTQVESQFFMGYVYLGAVSLLISVNLSVAVQNTVRKIQTKRKAKKMQQQLLVKLKLQKDNMLLKL